MGNISVYNLNENLGIFLPVSEHFLEFLNAIKLFPLIKMKAIYISMPISTTRTLLYVVVDSYQIKPYEDYELKYTIG